MNLMSCNVFLYCVGFVTFGIPTVKRNKAYYVIKTVKSLLDHMLPSEKEEVVIVIFIADQDEAFIDKLIKDTKQNFPQEVSDGLIHVVLPDKSYYPNLNNLPRLFGDKMERVKWRSKQCLDYSYLYYYSRNLAEYFVQLEDDIIAVDGYIAKMKEFIKKNQNKKWSVLEFGARGFIGMTYKSKHLESLSKFVRFFFWTMPVDILFRVYNDIYLHKNSKEFQIKPPVFKHIGKFSSLKGQVRTLEDLGEKSDSNVKGRRRYQSPKGNPPAKLSSSLKEFYLNNRLENPYTKTGVMWATKPKNGDTIDIMFSNRQHVKRIVFASGIDHKDVFYKTKLHVSSSKEGDSCVNYQLVGKFEGDIVDHSFTSNQQSIWCVRLELDVVHTIKGKPNWIFIEEIAILL